MKRLLLAGLTLAALQTAPVQAQTPDAPRPVEGRARPEGHATPRAEAARPAAPAAPAAAPSGQPSYRYGHGEARQGYNAPAPGAQVGGQATATSPAQPAMAPDGRSGRAFGAGAPQGPAFYHYGRPSASAGAPAQTFNGAQRPDGPSGYTGQGFQNSAVRSQSAAAQGAQGQNDRSRYVRGQGDARGYGEQRYGGGYARGRDDAGRDGPRRFTYGGRAYAAFHVSPYRFPRGYDYRFYHRGERFPLALLLPGYFLTDYSAYYLSAPPSPEYRWVRYGPDALLVDVDTGQVVDTAYAVFDDGQDYGYARPGAAPPADYYGAQQGYGGQYSGGQSYSEQAYPPQSGYAEPGYGQPNDPRRGYADPREPSPYGARPQGDWNGQADDDAPPPPR